MYRLTPAELLCLQHFHENHVLFKQKNLTRESLLNSVKMIPVMTTFHLAENDGDFKRWCLAPELETHWQKIWSFMGEYPSYKETVENPLLKYQPLLPQPGFHCFNLISGKMLDGHAALESPGVLSKEKEAQALAIVFQAVNLGNFTAYRRLSDWFYSSLEQSKEMNDVQQHILEILYSAYRHGAAGFMLLAECHIHLYLFFERTADDRKPIAKGLAFAYLYAAKLTEECSKEAIHNASFGKGLTAFNAYGYQTIDSMMTRCCNILGAERDITTFQRNQAMAHGFIRSYATFIEQANRTTVTPIFSNQMKIKKL